MVILPIKLNLQIKSTNSFRNFNKKRINSGYCILWRPAQSNAFSCARVPVIINAKMNDEAFIIRKAQLSEMSAISGLIHSFAQARLLLPRSMSELYENIRDFWVSVQNKTVVGCCALHVVGEDLAEIKSLAVHQDLQGQGLGGALVKAALQEAGSLLIPRILVLTQKPKFFSQFGFTSTDRQALPPKLWSECLRCADLVACCEEAMICEA